MGRGESWASAFTFFAAGVVMTALGVLQNKEFWQWGLRGGIGATLIGLMWLAVLYRTQPKVATSPSAPQLGRTAERSMVGDSYSNWGSNFGHIGPVHHGKQPFTLTTGLIRQVVEACPKNAPVTVVAVGTQKAFPMRDAVGAALEAAGYKVHLDSAMKYMPPPEGPLTVFPEEGRTTVLVAPNA